ncbi:MAG: hypothetical protein K2Y56_06480 [Methylobacterium sp.]|uniref:hypothetical protein n=1 Tax=Methylobacterium sp. TaxID=409 RepID=UPI0025FDDE1C|nr:hypothetical protein [Methylobacterium sp.]MBX9931170.1 hypothetical protein [Methylobacterium sp.]
MSDLDKALADIVAIRSQIARASAFQGYGPAALAATGGLALLTALAQHAWLDGAAPEPVAFLLTWVAVAFVSSAIIGAEMLARSRRHHSGLADAMILNAVEQFLPAGAVGALLALVMGRVSPENLWMMPGLWQILVSLGIFASLRSLPRGVVLAGAWYLVAGLVVLMVGSETHVLSPWAMGLPFTIGQFLLAAILQRASGEKDA